MTRLRKTIAAILDLPDPGRSVASKGRSGKWPRVRRGHLARQPGCAVCESTEDCDAHHVYPYHVFPDMELDPQNLITLCRAHHLFFGHLGEWAAFNPLVREHAGIARFCLRAREVVMGAARVEAKKMKRRKASKTACKSSKGRKTMRG